MQELKNNPNIKFYQYAITPLVTIYDENQKIAPYVRIGELFKATKVLDKEELHKNGIPLHKNALDVHTFLREKINKALYIGSAYRSYEWELFKNRTGTSQHVKALAIDLNGIGLVDLIEEAVKTENEVYKELRLSGVNAIGFYDWGIHLDFRPSKSTGEIYTWDDRKKKANSILIFLITFLLSSFFVRKYIKFPEKKRLKIRRR